MGAPESRHAPPARRPRCGRPVPDHGSTRVGRYGRGLPGPGHRRPSSGGEGDQGGSGRRSGVQGTVRRRGGGRPAGRAFLHRAGPGRRSRSSTALPGDRVHRRGPPRRRRHQPRAAVAVDVAGRRGRGGVRADRHPRRRDRAPRPEAEQRPAVLLGSAGHRFRYRQGSGRGSWAHPVRPGAGIGRLDGARADGGSAGRPVRRRLRLGSADRICRDRSPSLRRWCAAGGGAADGRRAADPGGSSRWSASAGRLDARPRSARPPVRRAPRPGVAR